MTATMMDKVRIIKTPIKHTFSYSLLCGVVTLSLSGLAVANETARNENSGSGIISADFDSDFLIGDAKKIDITKFANGNPILPGEYSLDVYVNGAWCLNPLQMTKAHLPALRPNSCLSSVSKLN